VIAGIAVVGLHIRRALEIEMTYGAYYSTLDALLLFMDETGRWPKNWDELRSADREKADRPRYGMSMRAPEVRELVRVDFSVTIEDVAKMDARHFTAVEAVDQGFLPWEDRVNVVIDEAKRQVAHEQGTKKPERRRSAIPLP
jgi:hypothetical protein